VVLLGTPNRSPTHLLGADDFISALLSDETIGAVKLDRIVHVPASVTASPLKPKPSRHRFEKPIHNVKKHGPFRTATAHQEQISVLHHLDIG